jgi:hypothetical protein
VHKSISFKLHIDEFKTVLLHTADDRKLFYAAVLSVLKGQSGTKRNSDSDELCAFVGLHCGKCRAVLRLIVWKCIGATTFPKVAKFLTVDKVHTSWKIKLSTTPL